MTQPDERHSSYKCHCGAILRGRVQKFWLILLLDICDGLRSLRDEWVCVYVITNEACAARSL